jgi:hypothetical protein
MLNHKLDMPNADEIEISVFGPSYGESVVMHIGDGKWLIVDSCADNGSDLPAPLAYLLRIGVDVSESVKMIVATHWHDDHVRGLYGVFNACASAKFVVPGIFQTEQLLLLLSQSSRPDTVNQSGLKEFHEIFKLLNDRKERNVKFNPPIIAVADKFLYSDVIRSSGDPYNVNVYALSPSDASIMQANLALSSFGAEVGGRPTRVMPPTPNDSSVVLWVDIGNQSALLGADLENAKDPSRGWTAILNGSSVVRGKSIFFKIPHHGSVNAHDESVWSELLHRDPYAVVSPYSRGRKPLPTTEDVSRISQLTTNAYATAPTRKRDKKFTSRVVGEFVKLTTSDIRQVDSGAGHVRLRKRISEPTNTWQVIMTGDAYRIVRN